MNLKNYKYMKSAEFKARQLWLGFVDAVGIALEVIADSIDNLREWFKKWSKKPMKNKADNLTLEMNFDEPTPTEPKTIHWTRCYPDDGTRPQEPKFYSSTWYEWFWLKSCGYSDKDLAKRIKEEKHYHNMSVKSVKEFQKQQKRPALH